MATAKIFDTVVLYDTPGTTDITPAPGEDAQIDLAAIGNDVTVHFDPAPANAVGKAIGVTVLSDAPGGAFGVNWTNAVDFLVPTPLQQSGDCELFTWDATAGLWRLVAAFRRSAMVLSSATIPAPVDATPLAPLSGEFSRIDMSGATVNVPVTFPPGGDFGQWIALQISTASPAGFAVETGYANLVALGDTAIFTCLGGGVWAQVVFDNRAGAALFPNITTHTPTDATPIDVLPGQYAQIALSSATDNVPINFVGGAVGQLACIKCTAPAPVVTIPFEFSIQPPGGTELKIRGDMSWWICTAPGTWEQLSFQGGNPVTVYEFNFVDGDLSGSDLSIPHRLNTLAPDVTIIDNAGALVPPGAGTWTLAVNNASQCTVTFDAGLLPLTDTWRVAVRGGSTPDLS